MNAKFKHQDNQYIHINEVLMEGSEVMAVADTYQEAKVIKFEGMTVRVFSPVLSPEERNKRMKAIQKAAMELLMDAERKKK